MRELPIIAWGLGRVRATWRRWRWWREERARDKAFGHRW